MDLTIFGREPSAIHSQIGYERTQVPASSQRVYVNEKAPQNQMVQGREYHISVPQ